MQLYPSLRLSAIVKHYLIIRNEHEVYANYRLFSDGNPGLVFHFKDPFLQQSDRQSRYVQPHSFVYGQLTQFNDIRSAGKLEMLIVVLQPHALYALLNLSAAELNNTIIPLNMIFGQEGKEIEDEVLSAPNLAQAITAIEQMLISRVNRFQQADRLIDRAINLIYHANGMIAVSDITKELPVTERQLERKFKEQIGIGPKKFMDVIKFQHFLKSMQKFPLDVKLSQVIYACGYYDQAHLNNCFKRHVGVTPMQYRNNTHLLAINLMEVS
ncbi:AraC family transcriptional regulator [Sphingobacterium faecium]